MIVKLYLVETDCKSKLCQQSKKTLKCLYIFDPKKKYV